MLYQVDVGYFCCGIVVDENTRRVTEAAPIMKWAVGKHLDDVRRWVLSKSGKLTRLRNFPDN